MKDFFTRVIFFFNNTFINIFEKKQLFYENNNFNRISLINFAILKFGYDCRYLEIGVFEDTVFNSIPLTLDKKIGVDPFKGGTHRMTSDEFFKNNNLKFDVIYIDGLHTYDQVLKDFINSINSLSDRGMIFIHDILPTKSIYQDSDRKTSVWNGDVWKLGLQLCQEGNFKKNFIISNIDYGVGIYKKRSKLNDLKILNKKKEYFAKLKYIDYKKRFKELPIKSVFESINFITKN